MVKLRGQTAAITLEEDGGTEIVVGTLDNPFVAVPQEVQELRGSGSVKWQDLQKTEQAVLIGGDITSFDLDAWDRLVGFDEVAGNLDDSPDVETFNATITADAADGSTKEIKAGPGYRNNDLELGGSREEWLGMTLELRCNDIISITNTTP
jgi:hypothetical protein